MEPLFIMRTAPGRTENTFGGADEDDPSPPALVDIIVPPGGPTQEKILAERQPEDRDASPKLPAVVPSKLAAPATK